MRRTLTTLHRIYFALCRWTLQHAAKSMSAAMEPIQHAMSLPFFGHMHAPIPRPHRAVHSANSVMVHWALVWVYCFCCTTLEMICYCGYGSRIVRRCRLWLRWWQRRRGWQWWWRWTRLPHGWGKLLMYEWHLKHYWFCITWFVDGCADEQENSYYTMAFTARHYLGLPHLQVAERTSDWAFA